VWVLVVGGDVVFRGDLDIFCGIDVE